MSRRGGEKRRWGGDRGSFGFGDGERRRSPRLSGHPQSDAHCNKQSNNNPVSSTRVTRSKHHHRLLPSCHSVYYPLVPHSRSCPKLQLKHSLNLPSPPLSCEQGDGAPIHRHIDHSNDDESWLPKKSSLELVLDTLQRRDTYEIFAEPVDPSEVEEYYEIIKEPMDFGTMRAKLHEGMYKNLKQFERDVYLIFGNAMYFNSSATVYFRQARALEDLARKLFFVMKTDPENFKVDYSTIRRRSSRRFDGEHSGLTFGSCRKLARDLGSYGMDTDLDRKGFGRQRTTCLTGVDRRLTYKRWMCLLDGASSVDSPIYCDTNSLICANQEEIRYKESLMLFVKDLGPTAHRVAKNKLQGLLMQASSSTRRPCINCWDNSSTHIRQAPAASSPVQREPNNFLFCSATSPASHRLSDIETTNDKKKPSDVSRTGEKSARSFLDTKSIITCTSLGTSDCASRDQVQGNMKSMAVVARGDKLQQNISSIHYGEEVDAIAHTGSKESKTTELTTPTVQRKDGDMLSYHESTMPPAVKETKLKQIQAGNNFELNQVQAIPSSSYLVRCSYKDDNLKTHEVIPSCGLLGATEFNRLSPAGHATTHEVVNDMQPSSVSSEFLYNLPYFKSRLIELSDDDVDNSSTTIGQPAALQLPSEMNSNCPLSIATKISFGKASGGYTNQKNMTPPYIMKTQLPDFYA